jgi:hypothetical protein
MQMAAVRGQTEGAALVSGIDHTINLQLTHKRHKTNQKPSDQGRRAGHGNTRHPGGQALSCTLSVDYI